MLPLPTEWSRNTQFGEKETERQRQIQLPMSKLRNVCRFLHHFFLFGFVCVLVCHAFEKYQIISNSREIESNCLFRFGHFRNELWILFAAISLSIPHTHLKSVKNLLKTFSRPHMRHHNEKPKAKEIMTGLGICSFHAHK